MNHFSIKRYVQICMAIKNVKSMKEVADLTKQEPSNLRNKLTRDDMKVSEMEKIANVLNADVSISFIDRATGKPII